jgi:hypothetical protein
MGTSSWGYALGKLVRKQQSKNFVIAVLTGIAVAGAGYYLLTSSAAQNPAADLNSDSKVDVLDLSTLLSNWNKTGSAIKGDLNGDSVVNVLDLSILLGSWGAVTAAPGTPYWSADWEEGPCTTISCYSDWSFVQAESSAEALPELNEVALASNLGISAHGGTDVGKFQTTQAALDAGRPHSKVFKEWQIPGTATKNDAFGRPLQAIPASGINGSYRAWFYIPSDYTFVPPEWVNIFQFKLTEQDPFKQDPQWWINIVGGSGNAPYLHVENWGNGSFTDPGGLKPAPKGRWFEIRADLYEGNKIDWYLDGQFWQTVSNTTYKIGRGGATGTPQSWVFGVGHYGGVGRIFTDDASFTPFSSASLTGVPTKQNGWWWADQNAIPFGSAACDIYGSTATVNALRAQWDYWDQCGGSEVSAVAEGLPATPWGGDHIFKWHKPLGNDQVYQKLNRTFISENWPGGGPFPNGSQNVSTIYDSPADVSGRYIVYQYIPSAKFKLNLNHGWVALSEYKENYIDNAGQWHQDPLWGFMCNNFTSWQSLPWGTVTCSFTPKTSPRIALSSISDRWVKFEYRIYQGAKDTTGHGGRIEFYIDDQLFDTGYQTDVAALGKSAHVGSAAFSTLAQTYGFIWIAGQYTSNQSTNGVPDYQNTEVTSYVGLSTVLPLPQ